MGTPGLRCLSTFVSTAPSHPQCLPFILHPIRSVHRPWIMDESPYLREILVLETLLSRKDFKELADAYKFVMFGWNIMGQHGDTHQTYFLILQT